jgi:hypothetical protein
MSPPKPQAKRGFSTGHQDGLGGGTKDADQRTDKLFNKKRPVVTGFTGKRRVPILNRPSGRLRVGTKMQAANKLALARLPFGP